MLKYLFLLVFLLQFYSCSPRPVIINQQGSTDTISNGNPPPNPNTTGGTTTGGTTTGGTTTGGTTTGGTTTGGTTTGGTTTGGTTTGGTTTGGTTTGGTTTGGTTTGGSTTTGGTTTGGTTTGGTTTGGDQPPNPVPGPSSNIGPAFLAPKTGVPFNTSLPTPVLTVKLEDETSAYIRWGQEVAIAGLDQSHKQGVQLINYPNSVHGFYVRWGVDGEELNRFALTQYGNLQVQPLEPGKTYAAVVHSVGRNGDLSPSSNTVRFKVNTTRVDGLRKTMTGFFDDFNLPAGHFDELKWSTTMQTQKDVTTDISPNGEFINAQFHAHTVSSTAHPNATSDRGWVLSRPRAVWDITGRTGELVFDLDHPSTSARNIWYLNLVPATQDPVIEGRIGNSSHVALGFPDPGFPIQYLRLKGSDGHGMSGIEFSYADETGVQRNITLPGAVHVGWDNRGLNFIPNYRRFFKLKLSKTRAEIWMDGVMLSAADINLPSEKLVPIWESFTYNTSKDGHRNYLQHWDNFGFDGPKSTIVTHAYKAALNNPGMIYTYSPSRTVLMDIPDSLTGSTRRRLFFGASYVGTNIWNFKFPGDWFVKINGTDILVSEPTALKISPSIESYYVGQLQTGQFALDIPAGLLKTGTNVIDFSGVKNVSILNVSVDVDFPSGSAPSYTQPVDILAAGQDRQKAGMPRMLTPNCLFHIKQFAEAPHVVGWEYNAQNVATTPVTLSGNVTIVSEIQSRISQFETGSTYGTKAVEIAVGDTVVAQESFDTIVPSPAQTEVSLSFDTKKIPNGSYNLEYRCISGDGKYGEAFKMYRDGGRMIIPVTIKN